MPPEGIVPKGSINIPFAMGVGTFSLTLDEGDTVLLSIVDMGAGVVTISGPGSAVWQPMHTYQSAGVPRVYALVNSPALSGTVTINASMFFGLAQIYSGARQAISLPWDSETLMAVFNTGDFTVVYPSEEEYFAVTVSGSMGVGMSNWQGGPASLPDVRASYSAMAGTLSFKDAVFSTPGNHQLELSGTNTGTTVAASRLCVLLEPPPPPELLEVEADPDELTVKRGESGNSTITIENAEGVVQLSASGLPTGVSASFATNPATSTSVLTLSASSTAQLGTATVTITGDE